MTRAVSQDIISDLQTMGVSLEAFAKLSIHDDSDATAASGGVAHSDDAASAAAAIAEKAKSDGPSPVKAPSDTA
jgi:hypothetical protein